MGGVIDLQDLSKTDRPAIFVFDGAAGSIAIILQRKPQWMRWQRWVTGTLLGAVGVKLAFDAPAPASS